MSRCCDSHRLWGRAVSWRQALALMSTRSPTGFTLLYCAMGMSASECWALAWQVPCVHFTYLSRDRRGADGPDGDAAASLRGGVIVSCACEAVLGVDVATVSHLRTRPRERDARADRRGIHGGKHGEKSTEERWRRKKLENSWRTQRTGGRGHDRLFEGGRRRRKGDHIATPARPWHRYASRLIFFWGRWPLPVGYRCPGRCPANETAVCRSRAAHHVAGVAWQT